MKEKSSTYKYILGDRIAPEFSSLKTWEMSTGQPTEPKTKSDLCYNGVILDDNAAQFTPIYGLSCHSSNVKT